MNARMAKVLSVALPAVVLAVMVVRAEVIRGTGRVYELPIRGYDPRDLLSGHYLRFTVVWNGPPGGCRSGPQCCVCFVKGTPAVDPAVDWRACGTADACDAVVPAPAARSLRKYYVPEDEATALETALRNRSASLRVSISGSGEVIIQDLLLEGQPWRQVLDAPLRPAAKDEAQEEAMPEEETVERGAPATGVAAPEP